MRGFRFLLKALFIFLVLGSAAVVFGIIGFCLEKHPLVASNAILSHKDVERVKLLLKQNNPKTLQQNSLNTLAVSERDLNLLMNYGLSHVDPLAGRLDLSMGNLTAQLTLSLPKNPFGSYLNICASISSAFNQIQVQQFQIGKLTIPPWVINPVLMIGHELLLWYEGYRLVSDQIDNINLSENRLKVEYRWRRELKTGLISKAKAFFISEQDKIRLKIYGDQLIRMADSMPKKPVSLADVLDKLFVTAKERTGLGGSAKDENRALILALALYANGSDVDKFIGIPSNENRPKHRRLDIRLHSRGDLAKHFIISAAIAVSANTGIADAIGLFKELDDSKGGSGFSFADLAADKAGVRFGQSATSSMKHAKIIQERMSKKISETDFMPKIDQLPESIMELEFKQRYIDVGSHEYEMVETEINRLIATCRIYL